MLLGRIYWMGRNVADGWEGADEIRFRFRFRDPISSGREIQMVRKNSKIEIGFWVLVFWLVG